MKATLKIELGKIAVDAEFDESDLALPLDEFIKRYVEPAFRQLIFEQKAILDSTALPDGGA